jgi:hypothetical protein
LLQYNTTAKALAALELSEPEPPDGIRHKRAAIYLGSLLAVPTEAECRAIPNKTP